MNTITVAFLPFLAAGTFRTYNKLNFIFGVIGGLHMTNAWRRFVAFMLAAPVAFIGTTTASLANTRSSPADSAWAETLRLNTLEAYTKFAMDYPDSRYANQAYAKLATDGRSANQADAPATAGHWDLGLASEPDLVPGTLMVV